MKISVAALLLCLGTASAGISPELSIGINSKGPDELAGVFDSSVTWSTEGKLRNTDYEAGVNMKADSLGGERPFSIWGRLNRSVGGWDLRANLDTKSDDFRRVDFDVEAKGGPTDCKLRAQGNLDTASQNGSIRQVGLSQSFDAPGGSATVAPSYNLATGKADVVLAYENRDSDTTITIAADMDKQRVTISQRLDADNEISPSITSDGDVEIAYKRTLGDGTLTANYKPNDSTSLSYEEGPWVAKVEAPMDGFYKLDGPQISIKRSVSVEAN